jgi:hypothetical protein
MEDERNPSERLDQRTRHFRAVGLTLIGGFLFFLQFYAPVTRVIAWFVHSPG